MILKNYEDADSILKPLAEEILDENHPARKAKVKFLFKVKFNNPHILGKCTRATGPWRFLTEYDYVITINKDFWEKADEIQKRALLYHELCHVEWKPPTENYPGGRWALRRHEVEEFFDVVDKFGLWMDNLKILSGIFEKVKESGNSN